MPAGIQISARAEEKRRPVTAPCTTTGLVKVRYGDNQQAVFNSRCQCELLIKHMKLKCGYTDLEGELDLISWRNGDLQGVSERRNLHEYASTCLKERETYVLVHIQHDEDEPNPEYISLLHNLEKFKPDLALKLHDLSRPQAKHIRAKWSSMSRKEMHNGQSDHPNSSAAPKQNLLTRKATGSKFLDLINSAMRSKDLLGGTEETRNKNSEK